MIARIAKGVAAGLLGVAIATPLAAAPASAAYSYEWDEGTASIGPLADSGAKCVSTDLASACFLPYGDKIYVYDITSTDHASAVARWFTDYGRWGTCRNSRGAGYWVVCNKDFKEGYTIKFEAQSYDGDTADWLGAPSDLVSSGT